MKSPVDRIGKRQQQKQAVTVGAIVAKPAMRSTHGSCARGAFVRRRRAAV
jgi:hypothetical protein